MPRPAAISYEQVAVLCAQLAADGQRPTISRLAVALGNKGSTRLISAYLKRYVEESGKLQLTPKRHRPGWSEELNQLADEFLGELRALAFADAATAFEADRAGWQAELNEMLQRVSEVELLREEAETLATQRQQTLEQQAALIMQLQTERDYLRTKLKQAEDLLTEQQDHTMRLTDNVLALKDQLLQQEQTWQQQLTERLQAQQASYAAEAEKARKIAQDERQYLMEQTYELRQAYARERATLEQAINSAQAETTLARQQGQQWRSELQQAQKQRDAVASRLTSAEANLNLQTMQLQIAQQQLQQLMSADQYPATPSTASTEEHPLTKQERS